MEKLFIWERGKWFLLCIKSESQECKSEFGLKPVPAFSGKDGENRNIKEGNRTSTLRDSYKPFNFRILEVDPSFTCDSFI